MMDLCVILAFFAMLLSPCFVAMATAIPAAAELGVRDESEPRFEDSDALFIPH